MIRLRLSQAAAQDIRAVDRYGTHSFGRTAADRYLRGLRRSLARLLEYPHLGVARDDLHRGLRSLKYRNHLIFYTVSDGMVEVQRIMHGSREMSSELFE